MKKMKRVLAAVLSAALIGAAFAGCSGQTTSDDQSSNAQAKYSIGVLQQVQHNALDRATEGFIAAVQETLGKDNVEINEQNANGDTPTCSTIAGQFVSNNVDLIFANGTSALEACVAATGDIPIVGTSITNYATALHMDADQWTGTTNINVTGTSDLAPLEEQANMFKELLPNIKSIGILYCSAEANSKYQADTITPYLEDLGYEVKVYTSADSNDIASVTTTACSEVDALYIPTDNTMASNTGIINNIAEPAGIPIIAGEEGICSGCGIATLSIDYYDIGYQAGQMAAKILSENADPATMEIGYASDLEKKYVPDRCEAMNITVPDDYVAITTE